ncbi:hypothetical protein ACFWFI_10585 [Streptomyces sp. NPDC060209]|uniref:hypothetical protein n=1 Tax=Streptomyces sp. NPDC060209 TaxID=3347073 RepID=UPI0036695E3C
MAPSRGWSLEQLDEPELVEVSQLVAEDESLEVSQAGEPGSVLGPGPAGMGRAVLEAGRRSRRLACAMSSVLPPA